MGNIFYCGILIYFNGLSNITWPYPIPGFIRIYNTLGTTAKYLQSNT